jgi:hypothetical protein
MDPGFQDDAPRFFTVEEADALVPALNVLFGRVSAARAELGPLVESFGAHESVDLLREAAPPPPGREADVARLRKLAGEITASVQHLNELGCLVKDLEVGLVDFYSLQDGEPIFLCWQFGEQSVTHWHTVDAGFAGRRPIEGVGSPRPAFPN